MWAVAKRRSRGAVWAGAGEERSVGGGEGETGEERERGCVDGGGGGTGREGGEDCTPPYL